MTQWRAAGGHVKILALTDGSAGHQTHNRRDLAKIRRKEALAAAALIEAEIQVWEERDGELEASLALRRKLIRTIREFTPDLIVTHRPADYHPDHRATAQLVQDATYLLLVPNIEPEVQPLTKLPPVLLAADRFTYPRAFRADWIIDTTAEIDSVTQLLHCHASQVYEWLPHTLGTRAPDSQRLDWLRNWYGQRPAAIARRYARSDVAFAEAFEISEYGGVFDAADLPPLRTVASSQ